LALKERGFKEGGIIPKGIDKLGKRPKKGSIYSNLDIIKVWL